MTCKVTVLGQPVPKGRPRFGKGRTYTPRATRIAEEAIAWSFKSEAGPSWRPLDQHVILRCEFHLKGCRRADLDNLVKLVADGLNGVAWTDDRLVGELHAVAYDQSTQPRTVITVTGT